MPLLPRKVLDADLIGCVQAVLSWLPNWGVLAFHCYALLILTISFTADGIGGPGRGQHHGWILVYL
jgi:hypothetical protein